MLPVVAELVLDHVFSLMKERLREDVNTFKIKFIVAKRKSIYFW